MKVNRVIISDHMMLRYLERVLKVDIEKLRASLLKRCKPYAEAGATRVTMDGASFRISVDCGIAVVTTVTVKDKRL